MFHFEIVKYDRNIIVFAVPRHARPCNALAWNEIDSNILAVALDKYRNDHCILLWDVMKSPLANDGKLL